MREGKPFFVGWEILIRQGFLGGKGGKELQTVGPV